MEHQTTDTAAPNEPDPRLVLDVLLRRARREMAADVRRGVLTESQAQALFRAKVRHYTSGLGLPLPLTA